MITSKITEIDEYAAAREITRRAAAFDDAPLKVLTIFDGWENLDPTKKPLETVEQRFFKDYAGRVNSFLFIKQTKKRQHGKTAKEI
jgi:hypothetical protein